ncbi:uncharacterized protein LOC124619722 [Schistocerca americana]|uniref:uncharacterized protein LOC124619722 n=1 Tax=Schistocerca americana TaxID=7009 RepID=UPI001F4F8CD5|nr:uncharacterized protein LOC124619722 [Schistocerca americana]
MRRNVAVYALQVLATLFALQGGGRCLRLLEVRVPPHVLLHGDAGLECEFDLQGEALYSVKWYKDGHEFYRFVPRDSPPRYLFQLAGVTVDEGNSSESVVMLRDAQLETTGRYRCEVSAEAPSFQTVSDHGDMLVVVLPEEGPSITGGRPRYHVGETVSVNCSSARSSPAAHLAWYINGHQVNESLLRGPETTTDDEGLATSVLGLEFVATAQHFQGGDLKLKCQASVSTVYWRSNEESAQPHAGAGLPPGQGQRARAMQSRATPPPLPPPQPTPQPTAASDRGVDGSSSPTHGGHEMLLSLVTMLATVAALS